MAISGFNQITVKPTIKASDQHIHAFAAHDAYHAWHAFDIPKGGFAIKNVKSNTFSALVASVSVPGIIILKFKL